ncbi:MAG TPA: hypothetical protein VE860_07395 [Chthoniobacterales bacterium]|jgi:hypothetical protein|nr:hypothetical protein [Chthoniobacterales bacterium]
MSRVLALALIVLSAAGFNPIFARSNTGGYKSLTCGNAVYSLYQDDSGLVSGVIVANLFSDVRIIVVITISTGSPGWRRGKSFTVPAHRIARIRFEGRYPEEGIAVGCSY